MSKTIILEDGYLHLRTQASIELVTHHIHAGSLWEYLAVLVEKDAVAEGKANQDSQLNQVVLDQLQQLQQQLGLMASNGGTPTLSVGSIPIGHSGTEVAVSVEDVASQTEIEPVEIPKIKLSTKKKKSFANMIKAGMGRME